MKQRKKVITLEQHLLIWLKKRDVISNYTKTNNLHVIWSGGIIYIHDGHDLVNVIFQSTHLNKIITGLEMPRPFKDKENFITNVH